MRLEARGEKLEPSEDSTKAGCGSHREVNGSESQRKAGGIRMVDEEARLRRRNHPGKRFLFENAMEKGSQLIQPRIS